MAPTYSVAMSGQVDWVGYTPVCFPLSPVVAM